MFQSFLLFIVAIFGLFLPVLAEHKPARHTSDQQKTVAACVAEWRATKMSQAKGMTQNTFVEQCRNEVVAQTAATSSPPAVRATTGIASAPPTPSRAAAHPEKRIAHRHGRRHARLHGEPAGAAAGADRGEGF